MKPSFGLFTTLSIVMLLSACGSSSGSKSDTPVIMPDTSTPEVIPDKETPEVVVECGSDINMHFPLKYSASLSNTLTVRGTSNCTTIDTISINGTEATTSDGYANWQVQLSLQPGLNSIIAVIQEGEKSHNVTLGSVESNELFNNPTDMALTSYGTTLYVVDSSRRHIVKINRATGERSVLSSTTVPNQNLYFGNLNGLALNEDDGLLYIGSRNVAGVDAGRKGWILAVDTTTGERSVLVDPFATAYTPLIWRVNELVYDSANKKLYASTQGKIYSIELDSAGTLGEQTLISSDTVPDTNNPFSSTGNLSMVLDATNERLFVLDDTEPQLLSVDVSAGNLGIRTPISDATSNGASWDRPSSIAMVDSDHVMVTDRRTSNLYDIDIIKVSLANGYRDIVRNASIDADKKITEEHEMIFDATRQQLLISNKNTNGLFSIDLSDYAQNMFAYNLNPGVVGVNNLENLERSAIDASNQTLYYQSEDADIKAFDLKTLKHSEFASVLGSDNGYDAIDSMSFDDVTNAVIVTGEFSNDAHVRSYAVNSATETIISDDATGTGDDLNEIWDWVRLNDTTAIIADDSISPTKYYELDMTTGNRTLIDVDYNTAPTNLEAEDIAISADKKTLYIVDDSSNAGLYALDLTTKTFTTITNSTLPADGNDLRLNDPESLELSSDGLSVYVGDNSESYLIKVNLSTGAREGFLGDINRSTNSWAERINGISVDTSRQVLYTTDTSTDVILMMDEITNEWVMVAE